MVSLKLVPLPRLPSCRRVRHPCERGGWPGGPREVLPACSQHSGTSPLSAALACQHPVVEGPLPSYPRAQRGKLRQRPTGSRGAVPRGSHLGSAPDSTPTRCLLCTSYKGLEKPPWHRWPWLGRDTEPLLSTLWRKAIRPALVVTAPLGDSILRFVPFWWLAWRRAWPHVPDFISSCGFLLLERGLFFSFVLCRVPEFPRL